MLVDRKDTQIQYTFVSSVSTYTVVSRKFVNVRLDRLGDSEGRITVARY